MKNSYDIPVKKSHRECLLDKVACRWHCLRITQANEVQMCNEKSSRNKSSSTPFSSTSIGLPKKNHNRWRERPPPLSVKIAGQFPLRYHISNKVACNEPILELLESGYPGFLISKKESQCIPINYRCTDLTSTNWTRISQVGLKRYKCSPHWSALAGFLSRTMQVHPFKLIRWMQDTTCLVRCMAFPEISQGFSCRLMRRVLKSYIPNIRTLGPVPIHFNFLQRRYASA